MRIFILAALLLAVPSISFGEPAFPAKAKRIVFLGDSITHAGHYISLLEAQLRLAGYQPEMINLGLPSETCSGLSEPEHPFPRPDVHERIDRALNKLKPDVVVACYGMNDGIYYPLSQERFAAYKAGVNQIIDKVHAAGTKLVLMTPPAFDPLPLKNKGKLLPAGADEYSWKEIYEDYDDVMRQYAEWVMQQSDRVEMVIDLHTAVTRYVDQKRKSNPEFTMSPDGVHVNNEGHAVLAAAIGNAWELDDPVVVDAGLLKLITGRQKLMHDAWLSEVGHKRPGVKPGLPIEQAKEQAKELEKQIRARALRQRDASHRLHRDVYSVHFAGSTQAGELSLFADFYLWIPPGVERVRGIIVHQHGCGAGASSAGLTAAVDLHWRALAQKWDCALMGSSYEGRAGEGCRLWCDPRNGSAKRFLQAIHRLAVESDHQELTDVPWCLWGHSGGGFWASIMHTMYPERIAAIWLQSGTAYDRWESGEIEPISLRDGVFGVPVMACPGAKEKDHERFHKAWDGSHAMFAAYRAKGAPFGIAPDPKSGHECGNARYLAIPFFDACLDQRLPNPGSAIQSLRDIDHSSSYFGRLNDQKVVPADSLDGDPTEMVWLPSESFADKWLQFVSGRDIRDTTPPPPPKDLAVDNTDQGIELSWAADADFESGVSGFRIDRDGETIGRFPEDRKARFGRPIFQSMSYSDTPDQPLARMHWIDTIATPGKRVTYQIQTINSVGLESKPAQVALDVD